MPALLSRKPAPVIVMGRKPSSTAATVAPSTSPRVHFASPASIVTSVSRPLKPKEAWSLYHFETHARACIHCHDPYMQYKTGRRLCPDGDALAQDMNLHIRMHDGEVYERITRGPEPARVEVTHGYVQVLGQLKVFEKQEKNRTRTSVVIPARRTEERYRGEDYRREQVYVRPHRTETVVEAGPRSGDRESRERRKESYAPIIDYYPRREVRREEKREERREEKAYRHDSRRDSGYAPAPAIDVNVNGKAYRTEIREPQSTRRADYGERRKSYYF